MVPIERSRLRVAEVALALPVLAIASLVFLQFDPPYPSWPTAFGVAVDPELWLPLLLGGVALLGAVEDGLGVTSVAVAALSVLTTWVAATSIYALTAGTAGGVFWGGVFTLRAGTLLSLAVVGRGAARAAGRRDLVGRFRNRLADA